MQLKSTWVSCASAISSTARNGRASRDVRTHGAAGLKRTPSPQPHRQRRNRLRPEGHATLYRRFRIKGPHPRANHANAQAKGEVHAFSNPFPRVARALITLAPDIGPRYFEDVAEVVNRAAHQTRLRCWRSWPATGLCPPLPSDAPDCSRKKDAPEVSIFRKVSFYCSS